MQKLFEDWRKYRTNIINEDQVVVDPTEKSVIDPKTNRDVTRFLTLAQQARGSFIDTLILRRRKEMEKKIGEQLSIIKGVTNLPTPSKFIDNVVSFINSTKIEFSFASPEAWGVAADAFYSARKNIIIFPNFEKYWVRKNDVKYFRAVTYHELGHALDRGIRNEFVKAAGTFQQFRSMLKGTGIWMRVDPEYPDSLDFFDAFLKIFSDDQRPERSSRGITPVEKVRRKITGTEKEVSAAEGRYYSQEVYEKLKTITNQRLRKKRAKEGLHEEFVYEFFASLKELTAMLGRNITHLDIEIACTSGADQEALRISDYPLKEWISSIRTLRDLDPNFAEQWSRSEINRYWRLLRAVKNIETMKMLDCSKGSKFIAKILNELI